MWRTRTKLLRGVVVFLIGCAILGFFMGVKGALPRGGAVAVDPGPPPAPTEGVIIEAAPMEEAIATPPATEDEPEAAEPEAKEKPKEPEKKAPEPKAEPAPPPAPREEPPPADPVGDLLDPPAPPEAVIY